MSDPQYKMVDGQLVEMSPDEVAALAAEGAQQRQAAAISSTTLDMGKSMYEILTS